MATVACTKNSAFRDHVLISWEGLSQTDDTGDGVLMLGDGDRTVQVIGDLGGGTVAIQGSLNNVDWQTLQDLEGNALTFTAAALAGILEAPPYVRPLLTGATGGDADVLISVGRS